MHVGEEWRIEIDVSYTEKTESYRGSRFGSNWDDWWIRAVMSSVSSQFKSLAAWKSWWSGSHCAIKMADALNKQCDPVNLPKVGVLVAFKSSKKVCERDLEDPHIASIAEAVLKSCPESKEGSAFLRRDAVMHLDAYWGNAILGKDPPNPALQKARRDRALREAQIAFELHPHVLCGKAERGRKAEVTYLKELALSQRKFRKSTASISRSSLGEATPAPTPARDAPAQPPPEKNQSFV